MASVMLPLFDQLIAVYELECCSPHSVFYIIVIPIIRKALLYFKIMKPIYSLIIILPTFCYCLFKKNYKSHSII